MAPAADSMQASTLHAIVWPKCNCDFAKKQAEKEAAKREETGKEPTVAQEGYNSCLAAKKRAKVLGIVDNNGDGDLCQMCEKAANEGTDHYIEESTNGTHNIRLHCDCTDEVPRLLTPRLLVSRLLVPLQ